MKNKTLDEAIEELVITLKKIKAPILEKFHAGVNLNKTQLTEFILTPPQSMYDLYKWSNGVISNKGDLIGNLTLFTTGVFLPIERAITKQKELAGDIYGWDKNKFPLFESGYGEYLLIECDPNSLNYGMLYHHYLGATDFDKIISKYDSLVSLFETTLLCYQRKIYKYDEDGMFDDNPKLEYELGKLINPRSEYWKLF